ncbi:hypothetical protein OCS_00351 [Ophiocordyceps sinensis CO18]|uniref:Zn(2)-C6 fungal-type DNA-binding domain protein n=1 Tax=Ophiocordyceps sinensis (strain Co18 / CGMCC 3.14243) TaxID=911162 RepID=T5AQC5_OPHSC|nr:hypothetical protein OCS_00351 [Ophiocordyceps sinensis CO18]
MEPDAGMADGVRKRVSTACEACRATKVRCRPSETPDVCQKYRPASSPFPLAGPGCLAFKRECISRTCPRPRRWQDSRLFHQSSSSSPPVGPSSTFTIDFAMPARSELGNGIELLRHSHEQLLDRLFPDDGGSDQQQWTWPGTADVQTPSTASAQSHFISIHEGHAKPLFNLASAESLLHSFRCTKLEHLPCIVLSADESVPHLAATRPFVLLAILAASAAPQGHGLYDDEFRRVLGHKLVAGGERSLELLQGILIYCSWYPFHLRPKEKLGFQYLRMAMDLIHDLELARELPATMDPTDQELHGIRAYLTYFHLTTTHFISWKKNPYMPSIYTPWTATYCDVLQGNARVEGDAVLAALCRNSCALYEAFQVTHEHSGQQHHHRRLILSGLATKLAEARATVSPAVASSLPFSLQCSFIDVYLDCGSLMRLPRATRQRPGGDGVLPLLPGKMHECVVKLRRLLDSLAALDEAVFPCFTVDDWLRLILTVALSLRLSFPMPECPEFDSSWARSQLQFDQFLGRMGSEMDSTSASKKVDVLSASRVIMGVIKAKYHGRLRALEERQAPPPEKAHGCPMFDTFLEPYLPLWEAGIGHAPLPSGSGEGSTVPLPVFHDLWATMTMNWAGQDNC